jgi:hypothetical protein
MFKSAGAMLALAAGALVLFGSSAAYGQAPPLNDNYLSSLIIPQAATTGSSDLTFTDNRDTTDATTQSDLFNPDQNGMPFGGAGPEPVTCDGATYGKTIWYDLHPRIPEEVEFEASGFPTVISVYQWSPTTSLITRRLSCQLSNGSLNDYAFPFELQAHMLYTVQIGGLQQPAGFAGGPLEFTATIFPDHDGDGRVDEIDACPNLAGVPQLAGCPPRLRPSIGLSWTGSGASVSVAQFNVSQIPGGTRVEARCGPCGLDQVATTGPHSSSVAFPAFVGRTLQPGTKLQLWVTKRPSGTGLYRYGAIGAYVSYVVKSGSIGGRVNRCLMPGSRTPRVTCPPGGVRKH